MRGRCASAAVLAAAMVLPVAGCGKDKPKIPQSDARVGAIGHSHVALFFTRSDDGGVQGEQAPAGTEVDLSDGRWLINPGGVGQPRDGDPRAAWLLLDLGSWTAQWRRVEYPIADAAQAIERAGLPQPLADRLYRGE